MRDILSLRVLWFVFLGSHLLYAVGMLFPSIRVWGVAQFAHIPWYFYSSALIITSASTIVVYRLVVARKNDPGKVQKANSYLLFGLLATVILMLAFYLFRVKIHFLGDGYTLLANLASENPIVKTRNFGETLIHKLVFALLSGESSTRALLTYQIVSYAGGLMFILTVLLSARGLFERTSDRVLFSLGLFGGGYMLLFFGYTEHYSLFVPSVALFALIGLLVTRGKLSRWLVLPPLALSIILHILGVVLIPAAIYVLLTGTKVETGWNKLVRPAKLIVMSVVAIVGAIVFIHYYNNSYFFRFAFVPLFSDRFTLEGYTLFSIKHMADILNLSILLYPGLLLMVAVLLVLPLRRLLRQKDNRFLLIMLFSTLGVGAIFDPKLGMARDWDLFSLAGVPLVLFAYYLMLQMRDHVKPASLVMVMSIALGFCSLVPRVAGQAIPEIGMAKICDYAKLDVKRSFNLFQQIHQYYWERGMYERSPLLHYDFDQYFPEYALTNTGRVLREQDNYKEAVPLFEQAIEHNPAFAPAYCNLGSCYLELGQYERAFDILRIANGLSPHRIQTLCDLGRAYHHNNQARQAEKCWKRALKIDNDYMPAGMSLLSLYAGSGEEKKYCQVLMDLAESREAPAVVHQQLGEYYIREGAFDRAFEQYVRAVERGLPREELEEVLRRYPQMAP